MSTHRKTYFRCLAACLVLLAGLASAWAENWQAFTIRVPTGRLGHSFLLGDDLSGPELLYSYGCGLDNATGYEGVLLWAYLDADRD